MSNAEMPSTQPAAPSTGVLLAPQLEWFDRWVAETGEPIPDFDAMPSMPNLPPLLRSRDGREVKTLEDWQARRDEIKSLLCHYVLGTFPDEIPRLTEAETLREVRERGAIGRKVRLVFDAGLQATIAIELIVPDGSGPFPVFMTQATHRSVGLIGLSRGYLVCVYPGADGDDQTDAFGAAYPRADWGRIARRAWLASRVLDYIQTLDVADMGTVAITGHSRNGKQSMIAAAFDERFTAVVSSSSGTGGSAPFRFVSENAYEESVEFMTRQPGTADWFHPRLRLFTGREHKLPIDIHGLLGLIAPRSCLLSVGLNDGVATTFADERNYLAGREVYRFLGRPEAVRIRYRPSGHDWDTETAQAYFDWFDRASGQGDASFPEELIHDFDWSAWRTRQDPQSLRPPTRGDGQSLNEFREHAVLWALGEAPPSAVSRGESYGCEPPHLSLRVGRDYNGSDVRRVGLSFGDYVRGHFYYQEGSPEPLPAVIWLHPFAYSTGAVGAYVRGQRIYHVLARKGFGVFTFDQLGFGTRLMEGRRFYDRHQQWSRLGEMVATVRAAVDCLLGAQGGFASPGQPGEELSLPKIDPDRIYLLGYSLGGMVALYAAALYARVAGVASFCGFTPLRTDTDRKHTGGIRRWWEWHALQPRLGLFDGREESIPYDFDDVLSLIAPRPCLIVSPLHDRDADSADVARCVTSARSAWRAAGCEERLVHLTPTDYNRFEEPQHAIFLQWVEEQCREQR
jgi:pimeloyl-ACP methyl ester carboxylesterase